MSKTNRTCSRRRLIAGLAAGAGALYATPGAFAEELTRTPRQTEGPFFPDRLPRDTDNDLLVINDGITPAVGTITHLSGRILDAKGNPVRNAVVEIWQVDRNGAYLHTRSANRKRFDTNFQGFGRFLTGLKGEYYFRTIKPVSYPGRTPHIHFAVEMPGARRFTTQCYIRGQAQNRRDGILQAVRDPKQRASLIVPFRPLAHSKLGELTAEFDIVLGHTPKIR